MTMNTRCTIEFENPIGNNVRFSRYISNSHRRNMLPYQLPRLRANMRPATTFVCVLRYTIRLQLVYLQSELGCQLMPRANIFQFHKHWTTPPACNNEWISYRRYMSIVAKGSLYACFQIPHPLCSQLILYCTSSLLMSSSDCCLPDTQSMLRAACLLI